jgi:short-subunit dehydrogenase
VALELLLLAFTPMKGISKFLERRTQHARGALTSALLGGGGITARPFAQRLAGAPKLQDALRDHTVLVSGASSGIGRAVAVRVADSGATAVLVARSEEKLLELKAEIERRGGRAQAYAADLSGGAEIDELLARLAADGVVVDVLINNAGRSIRRPIHDSYARLHDYERTMALNYFGSLRLILGLLPSMRQRKKGHIINVSSVGVQLGAPLFSAYVASKAALDAFTRVASVEARDDGVRFATVYMPLVRTAMIAPTAEYRDVAALTPEQAADLVLRPLVTREKHLGTRVARWFHLGHVVAPSLVECLQSLGFRLDRAPALAT